MPTLMPPLLPDAPPLAVRADCGLEALPGADPDPGLDPSPSARTLAALLDRCQAFSPEYGGGLSTHLPMALQALQGLGAPPARLHALFDAIAPRLPLRPVAAGRRQDGPQDGAQDFPQDSPQDGPQDSPQDGPQDGPQDHPQGHPQAPPQGRPPNTPPGPAMPALARPDDWPALLGRINAFEPLRQALAHLAARDGLAATLASALPLLMPGVAAVALHGLIRSAHGVAAGHADELVSGLAYWAARHAPLVAPAPASASASVSVSAAATPPPHTLSLAAWLAGLQALPMPVGAASNRIHQRMQAHAGVAGFAAVAGALALDDRTLDALARHAAGLYAASGNFTVLHLVTGCQAMRVLLPWLADAPGALRPFTIAAAAALRASGLRQIDRADPPGDPLASLATSPAGKQAENQAENQAAGPTAVPAQNLADNPTTSPAGNPATSRGASPTDAPPAAPLPWAEAVRRAIASDDEHVIKLVQACRCHHAATGAAVFQAAACRAVQNGLPTTPPTTPPATPPTTSPTTPPTKPPLTPP